jgi:uncharacterized protein YerC
MVRINKNYIEPKELEKLFQQCAYVLSPSDTKHTQRVLQELLGFEERITIAKRIATIMLLLENVSNYKISLHLKLSQSTVAATQTKLDAGHYSAILTTLGKDKIDYFKMLSALDSILHLGGILPHYNGIDRHKYSN